eukprot:m.143886 g.143886  ORF g.143886 m.143886 type:complete len:112 (+) comp30342_c0_seq1:421-756(+)
MKSWFHIYVVKLIFGCKVTDLILVCVEYVCWFPFWYLFVVTLHAHFNRFKVDVFLIRSEANCFTLPWLFFGTFRNKFKISVVFDPSVSSSNKASTSISTIQLSSVPSSVQL